MTSDEVVLVGASGLAREVLASGMDGVLGIVDDDGRLAGGDVGGTPILGVVDPAADLDQLLLVCIGPSLGRRRVVRRLEGLGVRAGRFATFVAASARVGSSSVVGTGSILLDGVVVTADAILGSHVVVMPNTTITHDDRIGDFATLAAGVALGGGVTVGEAAYLGMNASVRPGVRIGAGATIGMGAVVIHNVPEGETWAGVPARKVANKP